MKTWIWMAFALVGAVGIEAHAQQAELPTNYFQSLIHRFPKSCITPNFSDAPSKCSSAIYQAKKADGLDLFKIGKLDLFWYDVARFSCLESRVSEIRLDDCEANGQRCHANVDTKSSGNQSAEKTTPVRMITVARAHDRLERHFQDLVENTGLGQIPEIDDNGQAITLQEKIKQSCL